MKVPDNIAGEKHRLKYPKGFGNCLSHDFCWNTFNQVSSYTGKLILLEFYLCAFK